MTETEQAILQQLQAAIGGLELDSNHPLRQDINQLISVPETPAFRIAVFGPFNYGKSTLLNAILGQRTLPIDLIPTTGAAIVVRYGTELQTRIKLTNGRTLIEPGTEILKQFAILDDERRMREDVAAVEVWCPNSWLQTGVELLDLPGTNDREAQDALVRDSLLTADLVIQVLDGRKLMTLGEREHLRDWLQDRGIETVVFVVNFLNLLEPDQQQQVSQRMRFVAESFRSQLPLGVSNLYRVDALPALRARLKGNMADAQASGLPIFETALQTIVEAYQTQGWQPKARCLSAIAVNVCAALESKIEQLTQEIEGQAQRQNEQQLDLKRRAQTLLQKGYQDSVSDLRNWLAFPNLLQTYETSLTESLRTFDFMFWEAKQLRPDWDARRIAVIHWVHKTCDFFGLPQPVELWLTFPPEPVIEIPETPPTVTGADAQLDSAAPIAIATGLGLVIGGPVGAAVLGGASYLLNQFASPQENVPAPPEPIQVESIDRNAAFTYLEQWSQLALMSLDDYEATVKAVIYCPLSAHHSHQTTSQHHQLRFLRLTLMTLVDMLSISTSTGSRLPTSNDAG
ncbi:MAG: dynamin family protein [Aphanocapsa sp. GSE-SYN-MK-11-07L]|jgi:GTPase SAR1 family protein|nr:dynamin family protein [Aphanocapsa sp. GSE-SYN-MK-11-07L]